MKRTNALPRLLTSATALACVLASQAVAQTGVASLPLMPRGPHAVGTLRWVWTDAARPEVLSQSRASRRQVAVQLFYPAEQRARPVRAAYVPTPRVLLDSEAELTEAKRRVLLGVITHADSGAAIVRSPSRLPIVLFSHGLGVPGFSYTSFLEELASRGYVVALVEHPYSGLVELFGRIVGLNTDSAWTRARLLDPGIRNSLKASRTEVQAEDFRFVVRRLKALDRIGNRLDWSRLVAMGHSLGGTTAAEYCRVDPEPRACVDLDGRLGWSWPIYLQGLVQPFLYLRSDDLLHAENAVDSADIRKRIGYERAAYSRFRGPLCDYVQSGTAHMDFSDQPMMEAADAAKVVSLAGRLRRFEDITVAFLDEYDRADRPTLAGSAGKPGDWMQDCPATMVRDSAAAPRPQMGTRGDL
ncbi:MAG TPA: alpha/beta fold hydrolase [Gemmatimonadaceae bacterium]|nr:alpha/beta fold hydrolase [Gemmatimonadaceae bacterium]